MHKRLDDPQNFLENILWTGEKKVELSPSGVKLAQHFIKKKKTPSEKSSMVMLVWWSGAASGWLALNDGTMNSAHCKEIPDGEYPAIGSFPEAQEQLVYTAE